MIGDKTANDGGVIVEGEVHGNINFGYTIDQHQETLKGALLKQEALLERAHSAEKSLIQQKLSTFQNRLTNFETDFEKTKHELADAKKLLTRNENQIPPVQKQAAVAALNEGKLDLARTIFEDLSKASQERSAAAKRENADADIETAELEFALGEIAEQEVHWHEAFAHYSEAARLHPIYTHLISAQSMALHLANYKEAETLVKSALIAAKKEYGEATPEYGTSLNNLAVLLKETSRFEEAESIYKLALENTRQTQGENHPDFATTLNNLATFLQGRHRFGEAEPLLRRALKITRRTLGEDDPVFGTRLNNLAALLELMGRSAEAEPLFRQALHNARQTLGETHPEFGIRLNNLAGLLRATKRYDEAEPLFLQAVKVFEKSLVPTHPNRITAKQNLEIFMAERPARG